MTYLLAFLGWLSDRIIGLASKRPPDFVIGGGERPYLRRWWLLPRNWFFNVYLHQILRSDDDRALHDHPWPNCSIILRGCYAEVMPLVQRQPYSMDATSQTIAFRKAGHVVFRLPSHRHRIEVGRECWSLFITGPVVRAWGFACPRGWVHWKDFTNSADGGATIGRGCE